MSGDPIWLRRIGVVGIGAVFLSLIIWSIRFARLRRFAIEHSAAVCIKCEYILPRDDSGICPECGRAFTRTENERWWRRWLNV